VYFVPTVTKFGVFGTFFVRRWWATPTKALEMEDREWYLVGLFLGRFED
jgi:hypothetical protein